MYRTRSTIHYNSNLRLSWRTVGVHAANHRYVTGETVAAEHKFAIYSTSRDQSGLLTMPVTWTFRCNLKSSTDARRVLTRLRRSYVTVTSKPGRSEQMNVDRRRNVVVKFSVIFGLLVRHHAPCWWPDLRGSGLSGVRTPPSTSPNGSFPGCHYLNVKKLVSDADF